MSNRRKQLGFVAGIVLAALVVSAGTVPPAAWAQSQDGLRQRIQERIQNDDQLHERERAQLRQHLGDCDELGLGDQAIQALFPEASTPYRLASGSFQLLRCAGSRSRAAWTAAANPSGASNAAAASARGRTPRIRSPLIAPPLRSDAAVAAYHVETGLQGQLDPRTPMHAPVHAQDFATPA